MTKATTVDYAVIIFYLSLMVFIGYFFSKQIKSMGDFFSGGKRLPWWVSGLSVFMTMYSAYMFVGVASISYTNGLPIVNFYFLCGVGATIGLLSVAHLWRRANLTSPNEFMRKRYKENVQQIYAYTGIPLYVVGEGVKIYSVAKIISVVIGVPFEYSIVVTGIVMIVYAMMGGLLAVAVNDTLQFIILAVAVMMIWPFAYKGVGGFSGLMERVPSEFFNLTNTEFSWHYVIMGLLLTLIYWGGFWPNIQRFGAVKNESEARKTGILSSLSAFAVIPLFVLPPMMSRGLFTDLDPENAFIHLFLYYFPPGLIGLVVCAILGATMSSIDSNSNLVSNVITNDIYREKINPKASERKLLVFGRYVTAVYGIIAVGLAFYVGKTGGAFNWVINIFGLTSMPLTVPYFIGILYKRSPWWSPVLCMALGVIVSAIAKWGFALSWPMYTTVSLGATVLTMLITGWLWPDKGEKRKQVDDLFESLKIPVQEEINTDESAPVQQGPNTTAFIGKILLVLSVIFIMIFVVNHSHAQAFLNIVAAGIFGGLGVLLHLFTKTPLWSLTRK